MPAFNFTADPTSDQLTVVGHGLNTGDGPAATRNIGGALPGGLAPVTDYWIIRVDADHVKLATSNSDALAGVAINIANGGSGTQFLLLGLPYRRPRTYAKKSLVESDDFNAMFDSLVAIYGLLTGQAQGVFGGVNLAGALVVGGLLTPSGGTSGFTATGAITAPDFKHGDVTDMVLGCDFVSTSGGGVQNVVDGRVVTTLATTLFCRLPLRAGHRIKSITALVGGDGAVDITSLEVRKVARTGGGTPIGSTTANNVTGGDVTIDVTDTQLGVGEAIIVSITGNAALLAVDNCRFTYDRP